MLFRVMGYRIRIGRKQLIFPLSLGAAGLLLAKAGFGIISVVLLLGILCLLLRFATKPLARFIARLACSIRWYFRDRHRCYCHSVPVHRPDQRGSDELHAQRTPRNSGAGRRPAR